MAIYLVGDIQGCFSELKALLHRVEFSPKQDELWLAGDIVARGPHSLETIRYIKSLGDSGKMVLGNHDLHLLATYAGIKKPKQQDKLAKLLAAPDIEELMDWLACQPLIRKLPGNNAYMSHAGISPQWSIDEAVKQAAQAQQYLSSPDRVQWLKIMYGEKPDNWQQTKTDIEKFRYTINAFTRMRYCRPDLSLDFDCKQSPESAPENLKPWYELTPVINDSA